MIPPLLPPPLGVEFFILPFRFRCSVIYLEAVTCGAVF